MNPNIVTRSIFCVRNYKLPFLFYQEVLANRVDVLETKLKRYQKLLPSGKQYYQYYRYKESRLIQSWSFIYLNLTQTLFSCCMSQSCLSTVELLGLPRRPDYKMQSNHGGCWEEVWGFYVSPKIFHFIIVFWSKMVHSGLKSYFSTWRCVGRVKFWMFMTGKLYFISTSLSDKWVWDLFQL